jgi:peptide/nickel transport system permease protein
LVSYIIRRLIAAVGLVIVISMITFAIFYLIPRMAARRRDRWRPATWASPDPPSCRPRPSPLGFYDPVPVQYWHWLQGVLVGRT